MTVEVAAMLRSALGAVARRDAAALAEQLGDAFTLDLGTRSLSRDETLAWLREAAVDATEHWTLDCWVVQPPRLSATVSLADDRVALRLRAAVFASIDETARILDAALVVDRPHVPLAAGVDPSIGEGGEVQATQESLEGFRLSARQLEVARHVAEGRSDDEIAEAMTISPASVRTYLGEVYRRLGISSRVELIRRAQGLILS